MNEYKLSELVNSFSGNIINIVGTIERTITHPMPIHEADNNSVITFCSRIGAEGRELINSTNAGVILCSNDLDVSGLNIDEKTLIVVKTPRLTFLRLIQENFTEARPSGIHPSAIIDPNAEIASDVYIGPLAYIGSCKIGAGTIIYGNVYIYSNTQIGRNVVIHAGTIIGADGFGFQGNEARELEKFPHIGGVVIDDDVELQAHCHVSRGTMGNTIIRRGSKFDSGCHIAHNVVIGENCLFAAHAMIAGSVKIGNNVWVGPSAAISDRITIGDGAKITIGAVVTKNVLAEQRVSGNFAIDHRRFIDFIKAIR